MNILIDIGHPAHVHLLKNLAYELKQRGHNLFFSVRDIPIAKRLMDTYGMTPYIDLGGKKDSLLGKAQTVISQDWKLLRFVKKHKIDIGLSSGIVLSHVSRLTSMTSINFDDDDDAAEKLVVKYCHPLTDIVFTPKCISRKTKNALYYSGTHELAYLHPKRFVPDSSILEKAGLTPEDKFFIIRFVAFKGHHDVGQEGLSIEQKRRIINLLKGYGRVIITSEKPIEPEFEQYRLPVPPEEIHSLMAYASLFLGDSQTMTTEAALLGVPAIKCNTFAGKLSVPNMLEQQYDLCYAYHPMDFEKFYEHTKKLLNTPNLKAIWEEKRKKFLKDNIDVTAFFCWFIESYPKSKQAFIENSDIQYQFK